MVICAKTITYAEFCSGTGMLGYSVEIALESRGLCAKPVVRVEREAIAAAMGVLIAKAADRECPVWDDLVSFDGRPWRGCVDIAVAGLPCPAFSQAGSRKGNDDDRAWGGGFDPDDLETWGPQPHFLRIVNEMRPALVFLENVPGWLTSGSFRRFGDELCGMGYEIAEPEFVTAREVGAPHVRERVFVMAYTSIADGRKGIREKNVQTRRKNSNRSTAVLYADMGRKSELANSCYQRRRAQGHNQVETEKPASRGSELEYSNSKRRKETRCRCNTEPSDGRDDIPLFPPAKNDYRSWDSVAELDASRMPAIESGFSVVAYGLGLTNGDLLRIGGNGVCTLAAAYAFGTIFDRIV